MPLDEATMPLESTKGQIEYLRTYGDWGVDSKGQWWPLTAPTTPVILKETQEEPMPAQIERGNPSYIEVIRAYEDVVVHLRQTPYEGHNDDYKRLHQQARDLSFNFSVWTLPDLISPPKDGEK